MTVTGKGQSPAFGSGASAIAAPPIPLSLAERHRQLRSQLERLEQQAPTEVSPDEAFTWGKYKGKSTTFQGVYDTDPSYVQWCSARLAGPASSDQRRWLDYITKRITKAEGELEEAKATPTYVGTAKSGQVPYPEDLENLENRVSGLELMMDGLLGRFEASVTSAKQQTQQRLK